MGEPIEVLPVGQLLLYKVHLNDFSLRVRVFGEHLEAGNYKFDR